MGALTYSPKCFAGPKRWAVEVDYIHKLSPEERKWLVRFQTEYHNGQIKKDDPDSLHKSTPLRRNCYQRTNWAMRDLFAIKSCCNQLLSGIIDGAILSAPLGKVEDELISKIDAMKYRNAGLVARAFNVLDEVRQNGKSKTNQSKAGRKASSGAGRNGANREKRTISPEGRTVLRRSRTGNS